MICSGEMPDLKIPEPEWFRAFWPNSHEQHSSQIKDLYRDLANNINFHYRTNSGKINDQIFLVETETEVEFLYTSEIIYHAKNTPRKKKTKTP